MGGSSDMADRNIPFFIFSFYLPFGRLNESRSAFVLQQFECHFKCQSFGALPICLEKVAKLKAWSKESLTLGTY